MILLLVVLMLCDVLFLDGITLLCVGIGFYLPLAPSSSEMVSSEVIYSVIMMVILFFIFTI